MPHRRTARLSSWQIKLLVWSGILLWLTGAIWLGLHYFGRMEGEFGPEINSFEPWMLRIHGFLIITALAGFGSLLVVHIPLGWKDKAQRPAAIGLTSVFVLLILSGYALYYVGTVELREYSSVFHWVLGLLSPLIFWWHYKRRYSVQSAKKS